MAEFVSAIVALVAIGAQAGNSLYDISKTIKEAPDEFLNLWTEEAEFRRVLSSVLEERQLDQLTPAQNRSYNEIDKVLERSFEKLQEVRLLVHKLTKKKRSNKGPLRVDRIKWIVMVKKARKLQEDLYAQKSAIQEM